VAVLAAAAFAVMSGCAAKPTQPDVKPVTQRVSAKDVPAFMENTVWQHVDLYNAEPLRVSGYGLVVGLNGTGDTRAPNPVREYMTKEMQKHGFGSSVMRGFEKLTPEQVLNDRQRRTAIVRVDGFIPPGCRKGQLFDAQVSALENSNTTSLHRGILYSADLSPRGADPLSPGASSINPWARVAGPIFVNPQYALENNPQTPSEKLSLRYGLVMGRGRAIDDRPLILKLRQPQARLTRSIEKRIRERFQDSTIANAKNDGEVWVNVPASYGDDWERFIGVVLHLYFSPDNEYLALKAKQLAELATKDKGEAPLMDISFCWEAIGTPALPAMRPLLLSESPEVQYAAARAAAYLGDMAAQQTLTRIAESAANPFRLDAVRTLGGLPPTAYVQQSLRRLLDGDGNLVRQEAYKALLRTHDRNNESSFIYSQSVQEKFVLDLVPSSGPPLIYASRTGKPRIAVIGQRTTLASPILYMAMNNSFTIVSGETPGSVNVFYRGQEGEKDVSIQTPPDAAVLIARLGGRAAPDEPQLNFTYGDIVAVLQQLADKKLILSDPSVGQQQVAAAFGMESATDALLDPVMGAAPIIETGQRPQGGDDSTSPLPGETPAPAPPAAVRPAK
ncbi:MAG TPA: flagellar basal body P-ring protein FlgI, partial [Tepidisphaeraceae bacterium]